MGHFRANAAALKARRQATGYIKARVAAQQIGCTTNLLIKLETATGAPIDDALLNRIAQVYDCDPESLVIPLSPAEDRRLCPSSLQLLRKAQGLSLKDLATLSGICFSSLWRWEQTPGLTQFDFNLIRRVAHALGCTVEDLTVPVSEYDTCIPQELAG